MLELLEIGANGGFLVRDGRRERTREIGAQLDARGGISAMRLAHQEVAYRMPFEASDLEWAWHGIGDWQA